MPMAPLAGPDSDSDPTSYASPTPRANLEPRHFFTCGGLTLSWEQTWYTEPFYTTAESSYDSVASTGPVNPPSSIYDTIPACSYILSEERATSTSAHVTITSTTSHSSSTSAVSRSLSTAAVTPTSATVVPAIATGASINTCAGDVDWQSWAAVSSAFLAIVLGGLVWLLWLTLRSKLLPFYSPRTWFVRHDLRPSATPNLLAFFLPFLHLPSLRTAPASDGQVFLHLQWSFLKLASISSLLVLSAGLPIIIAGVPCLSSTAPPNPLGGRLGSFTDLTLMRLLDALDPSPDSSATQAHLRVLRALPSTIAPAISNARTRLILLLVLAAVVSVGGSLFVIARVYRKLALHQREYEKACGGQEMVVFAVKDNPAWAGLSEVAVQRSILKNDVVLNGVFAVPEMTNLCALVAQRSTILDQLETAETRFINLGTKAPVRPPPPTTRPPENKNNRLSRQSRLTSISSTSTGPIAVIPAGHGAGGSAFVELDRASLHPDPFRVGRIAHVGSSPEVHGTPSPAIIETSPPTPETSPRPDGNAPTLEIQRLRGEMMELNSEVRERQEATFVDMASGKGVIGWIVVGRGVGRVGKGRIVEGNTKGDILWENIGRTRGETGLWVGTAVTTCILMILSVPVLGLSNASAPGFAHYLPFLRPLEDGNGFPEGLAEGIAPALGLAVLVGVGVGVAFGLAKRVRPVSYVHQRALHFKATFWILFGVTVFWTFIGALEYAVQGFTIQVQETRTLGDGVSFTTWIVFILLLNFAIIVPGLTLLQPSRLISWFRQRRRVLTPRQRFRLNVPPMFDPTVACATSLVAVIYAFTLLLIFPLLSIPIFVLVYLSLVANHQLVNYVFCATRGGPDGGELAIWAVKRVAWALCLQPLVYGLVILSRDEWAVGGASVGVAVVTLALAVGITSYRARRDDNAEEPSGKSREATGDSSQPLLEDEARQAHLAQQRSRLESNQSILALIHSVLPSVSRLDQSISIPFETDLIDDLVSPHRAAFATPQGRGDDEGGDMGKERPREDREEGRGETSGKPLRSAVHDEAKDTRGLVYPPQLLAPIPEVWLPNDRAGVGRDEVESLARDGIHAMVDPVDSMRDGRGR